MLIRIALVIFYVGGHTVNYSLPSFCPSTLMLRVSCSPAGRVKLKGAACLGGATHGSGSRVDRNAALRHVSPRKIRIICGLQMTNERQRDPK